jgi:hypothetical protein
MSGIFDTLQKRYQALVARQEGGEEGQDLQEDVKAFIADARQAGKSVADLDERSQLRAWMRFLATVVYDATGIYPDVALQPLARGRLVGPQPERREKPSPVPPLTWMLVGGAALVIIAVGLVLVGNSGKLVGTGAEETPTPALLPFVSHVAVGAGLDSSGALQAAADTFCLGTPEIVAELALEGVQPEMEWRWEVKRDGAVVATQPAVPWGERTQPATIRILTGGSAGVEAGQYDLLVYAGERVVGIHSLWVLDTVPRAFDLRVADVPAPAEEAPGASQFGSGVRAIYVSYEFEGLCPGLAVSYTLYHEGEPLQERAEVWSGAPQGHTQAAFQAPGDLPFPSGVYEAAVAVAGQEQGRVRFAVGEVTTEMEAIAPAFGDVAVALGVQSDGTPLLTAPDNRFDWNTKAVYAVFDYVGMRDGLAWMAVWTRNGAEVAREERSWDVGTGGTEGTHWVTYYDTRGQVLAGGTYSVTLYLEDVAQRTADFQILYYVPRASPTPAPGS